MTPTKWLRVTKRRPCPICGKPDYCGIADDGTATVCMRIESGKPTKNGGWLHKAGESPVDVQYAERSKKKQIIHSDAWAAKHVAYTNSMSCREILSKRLGCSERVMECFGVGWASKLKAFTMPMRDAYEAITGFQTRDIDGKKMSVFGSTAGLFYDPAADVLDSVFVCEGFSDTVTLADLGFYAVGRPGCAACVDLAVKFTEKMHVVIMADAGKPGQEGAYTLAGAMRGHARTVRVVTPPKPYDDARAWRAGGATGEDVQEFAMMRKPL